MTENLDELEPLTRTTRLLAALADDGRHDRDWSIFKERFDGFIRACCWQMGLQSADEDDVTQEVLAKLFRKVKRFVSGPKRPFRPWLKVVVENSIRSYWRKQKRRPGDRGSGDTGVGENLRNVPVPVDSHPVETARALEEQLEKDRLLREAFERVKGRVESKTWHAFWLTMGENLNGREVSERLEMPVATVFVYKGRVLKMIRKEMGLDS
jgi:RNA polymerase sigma factor (sigma-70 family)